MAACQATLSRNGYRSALRFFCASPERFLNSLLEERFSTGSQI
jgi:hypothetical protein